jgi:hypothetical protein
MGTFQKGGVLGDGRKPRIAVLRLSIGVWSGRNLALTSLLILSRAVVESRKKMEKRNCITKRRRQDEKV